MHQFALLSLLAIALPAVSATAGERGWFAEHGWGRYGGNRWEEQWDNGFDAPNTFMTVTGTPTPVGFTGASSNPANPSDPSTFTPSTGSTPSGSVDGSLIPAFGVTPGVPLNDGTPRCVGDQGRPIECDCPPNFNTFLSAIESAVSAGEPFPTGNSAAEQLARLNTCIVTLQSIKGAPGSGVGCPIVSTTWTGLRNQLQSQL